MATCCRCLWKADLRLPTSRPRSPRSSAGKSGSRKQRRADVGAAFHFFQPSITGWGSGDRGRRHSAPHLGVLVLPHGRHSPVARHLEHRRGSEGRQEVSVGMSRRRRGVAPLWRLQRRAQSSARGRGPSWRTSPLQRHAGGQVLVKELWRERTSESHALLLLGSGVHRGVASCREAKSQSLNDLGCIQGPLQKKTKAFE